MSTHIEDTKDTNLGDSISIEKDVYQHTDSVEVSYLTDIAIEVWNQNCDKSAPEAMRAVVTALQAHTSQQVEELTAEITDLKATCFTMDDVQQQVEEAVLQADATGAYHSGYLAGKAEVEEAVRAERSRIYGRLAQMKSVYETMDTGSALVALLGEDIIREVTPNHQD